MTCQEIRSELPAAPLGLVEDRRAWIDAHVAGCPDCAARVAVLDQAYDELSAPLPPRAGDPEALWSKIESAIEGLPFDEDEPAARPQVHIALSCAYCHDALARVEARYCASCLTPHHAECFREHGRCAALACEEIQTVRPSIEAEPAPPRRSRASGPLKTLVGLALVGAISVAAYVGSTQLRATQQAFRDELVAQREALAKVIKEREPATKETATPPRPEAGSREGVFENLDPLAFAAGGLPIEDHGPSAFPAGCETVADALDWLFAEHKRLIFAPPEIGERPFEATGKQGSVRDLIRELGRQAGARPAFFDRFPAALLRPERPVTAGSDQDPRDVLSEAAAVSGQQIVFFGVDGRRSTARFRDVSWTEVFSTFTQTRGLSYRSYDGVILASGVALSGGRKLEYCPELSFKAALDTFPWVKDRAEDLVSFEGRRSLSAWVEHINASLAGTKGFRPVRVQGAAPKQELRLVRGRYHFQKALIALALLTDLDLREEGGGLILAPRPDYRGAIYRARGVPSDVWLLALSKIAGEENLVLDESRPRLCFDLSGISARSALAASALSGGLKVEKKGSILQVYERSQGYATIGDRGRCGVSVPVTLKARRLGRSLGTYTTMLEFQGLIFPKDGEPLAFIEDACYRVGDQVQVRSVGGSLRLDFIERDGIVLSNPAAAEGEDAQIRARLP